MIDKNLHDYLIKVLNSFLTVAKADDPQYFSNFSDDKIHVIYASPELFMSRKGKRIVQNDKKFLKKPLFAPYDYTLYIPHSFPLSQNGNLHPEAPKLYLDAFLVDNSTPENQTVYMLIGSNSDNAIIIKSYDRLPDGKIIAVGNTVCISDLDYCEKDMVEYANTFISSICITISKCKLNKVKSPIYLQVAEL